MLLFHPLQPQLHPKFHLMHSRLDVQHPDHEPRSGGTEANDDGYAFHSRLVIHQCHS